MHKGLTYVRPQKELNNSKDARVSSFVAANVSNTNECQAQDKLHTEVQTRRLCPCDLRVRDNRSAVERTYTSS